MGTLRNNIKLILEEEDFDWARDSRSRIEIGEPIDAPKNKFKIAIDYMHGDADGYTNEYHMIDGNNLEFLDKIITVYEALDGSREPDDAIRELIGKGIRPWDLEEDGWDDEDKAKAEEDESLLVRWFRDILSDNEYLEYDMHYDGYARMDGFKVTYFNHQGLEHKVKINKQ